MKIIKNNLIISLALVMIVTTACEDKDATPESGTISGMVTFTGTWPNAGTVSISIQNAWPPTGAPYASMVITSTDLSSEQYGYTFGIVAFATYAAITVSWLDPDDPNPATNQHTLGAFGGMYPFFTQYGGTDPTAVTVSVTDYSKAGLDFSADLSLATP